MFRPSWSGESEVLGSLSSPPPPPWSNFYYLSKTGDDVYIRSADFVFITPACKPLFPWRTPGGEENIGGGVFIMGGATIYCEENIGGDVYYGWCSYIKDSIKVMDLYSVLSVPVVVRRECDLWCCIIPKRFTYKTDYGSRRSIRR